MQNLLENLMQHPLLSKVLLVVLLVVVLIFLVRLIQGLLSRNIHEMATRYRMRKLVAFIGYLFGTITLLVVFVDRLGSLNVALGIAGAGIAFALQEVIASLAAWVAITTARFYKTGDRILLNGVRGDVIDIGFLRTTIMEMGDWVDGDLYNGRIVRIANSAILKGPVYNYSDEFPFLWDEIKVPIRHESDLRRARQILETVAEEISGTFAREALAAWKKIVGRYMIEDALVAPLITLVADENWVTFTIRYAVDFKARRRTKDLLFTRILEEVGKTAGAVNIATASQEITLLRNE